MNMPLPLRIAAACLAATLAVAGCRKQERPAAAPVAALVVVPDSAGMNHPESVLYDPAADLYLVDNINGDPLGQDGNGFISRVAPDGRVTVLKWIAGGVNGVTLNAPKGSALKGDTLFVADIDAVRMFDRTSGAPLGSIAIPGATFLNDLCVGPDGTVYITDTGMRESGSQFVPDGSDAVWKLGPDHRPIALARGTALGGPNGIIADSAGVTIVTFGSGRVFRLDAAGGRTDLPTPPQGGLDGIVRLPDGSLLVTSWAGKAVYRLAAGAYTTVADSIGSPADIGWDPTRNRLLIPDMMANRLIFRVLE
jgi:sugar lactone lactonase YvrE